jgi:hypothetical protein
VEHKDIALDPELWWYFNEAAGDVGGMHASPLEPTTRATGKPDDSAVLARFGAVGRYRDMGCVLGALSDEDVRLLAAMHRPVPVRLRPVLASLGLLALPVLELAPSPEWALERLGGTKRNRELAALEDQAKRKVKRALKAFRAEWTAWRKATRETSRGSKRSA